MRRYLLSSLLLAPCLLLAASPPSGFISKDGKVLFPIGSYEIPKDDAGLKEMADAGINLFRCGGKADLDRVAAVGGKGWVPLSMQLGGADQRLRAHILEVKDHPALAAWEGPDEIVWGFTAFSGLFRNKTYPSRNEWWRQTPLAIDFSEREAAKVMPNLISAAKLIRQLDPNGRPIWINEAARSDLKFIRQYLDSIDITGCDDYPIHAATRKPMSVADYTTRFRKAGREKPVWMVLQGFAWGQLEGINEDTTYPTFSETRAMAWSTITHGAKAVLYWGMSAAPPDPAFRQSLYAMTSELAAVEPFLVAPEATATRVEVIDSEEFDTPSRGVTSIARRVGTDWLVVLVNEDDRPHMGVVVHGLTGAGPLEELYSPYRAGVHRGQLVTRLMPYEVKVFASSRKWESKRTRGRDFVKP